MDHERCYHGLWSRDRGNTGSSGGFRWSNVVVVGITHRSGAPLRRSSGNPRRGIVFHLRYEPRSRHDESRSTSAGECSGALDAERAGLRHYSGLRGRAGDARSQAPSCSPRHSSSDSRSAQRMKPPTQADSSNLERHHVTHAIIIVGNRSPEKAMEAVGYRDEEHCGTGFTGEDRSPLISGGSA